MSLPYPLPFSLPGPLSSELENLSFEIAGAGAGAAFKWTRTETITWEMRAVWGTVAVDGEAFEVEWDTNEDYLFTFAPGDIEPAIFDVDLDSPTGEEDFEDGWGTTADMLPADLSAGVDTFESGWDNDTYWLALVATDRALYSTNLLAGNVVAGDTDCIPTVPQRFPVDGDYEVLLNNGSGLREQITGTGLVVIGSLRIQFATEVQSGPFNAGPSTVSLVAELFETLWDGNETYNFEMVSEATALFVLGSETRETFDAYTMLQLGVAPATDLFTTTVAHSNNPDEQVFFELHGEGRLPEGVLPELPYFVIATGHTTTAFKVSMEEGGTVIDVADYGFGTFFVGRDKRIFWNIRPGPGIL